MVSALSKFAFVLALAQAVTAVSTRSLFPRALLGRQGGGIIDPSDIAPQCQSQCATMVNVFNSCSTNSCLCTNTVMAGTADCLSCSLYVGGAPSAALLSRAQAALEELEASCNSVGETVSSYTVSGAAAVPTSAGAGTASIPPATATSQSVFFSSPGVGASGTASATGATGATTPSARVTVSSLPTESADNASQTTDPTLNPSATGGANNAASRTGAGAFLGVAVVAGLALL